MLTGRTPEVLNTAVRGYAVYLCALCGCVCYVNVCGVCACVVV